ncbi:MAG: ABC transporter permease [Spirochaetales bacterium]|nr:ABC transporter permease [Spirochaetales bacterium]
MKQGERLPRTSSFFVQWEFILLVIFVLFNLVMSFTHPNYLRVTNLFDMTFIFSEKALVALIMTFIIITGNIDISVASMMGLSSVVLAVLFDGGMNVWLASLVGLAVGTACGFVNGFIITRVKLPALIVTLANFSFYRGIAYVILGDEAVSGFPKSFLYLGRGYLGGTPVPFILVFFAVLAVAAGIVLHRTKFGRSLHAIGWNEHTCYASGIPVDRIKLLLFTLSGLMAGLAAVFITSRIGNTRPNIATGFELEIITIVILGGVMITGGVGKMWGVVLSIFLVGTIRYGLGLHNVPGQYMLIVTGALLILSILMNNLIVRYVGSRYLKAVSSAEPGGEPAGEPAGKPVGERSE